MIPYVDTQLAIWGKAQSREASKGLGFSSVCPMFRDMKHGGVYGSAVPIGIASREHITDTGKAIARLQVEERQFVWEFYVIGGKAVEIAERLGMQRQRLYEKLHVIHAKVLGLLNDVVAESVDTSGQFRYKAANL